MKGLRLPPLEYFLTDVCYPLRVLRQSAGFTAVAIVTLPLICAYPGAMLVKVITSSEKKCQGRVVLDPAQGASLSLFRKVPPLLAYTYVAAPHFPI